MNTISLELNKEQISLIDQLYGDSKVDKLPNPYMVSFYKLLNCNISVYKSNKVVFQGSEAEEYASLFILDNYNKVRKENGLHAGSDEVGTGDFFGPICVCAAIVKDEDFEFLDSLGVRDSKQIDDKKIREIAPSIIERIPHSLLVLDNAKYNEVIKTNNMNCIKAKMHNKCFLNLESKYGLPEHVYLDQFCEPAKYFEYLKDQEEIFPDIVFETKAEDKYLAVACGAIISRYAFLKSIDNMNQHYNFNFEKGAGTIVDECGKKFVKEYGEKELRNVCKLNFKNVTKII